MPVIGNRVIPVIREDYAGEVILRYIEPRAKANPEGIWPVIGVTVEQARRMEGWRDRMEHDA